MAMPTAILPIAHTKQRPPQRGGPSQTLSPLLLFGAGGFLVFPAEALHASGGVHQLLLAGKERVAIRADFQADIALVGGPGGKCIAARTVHADFFILGMDSCLHFASEPFAVKPYFTSD